MCKFTVRMVDNAEVTENTSENGINTVNPTFRVFKDMYSSQS